MRITYVCGVCGHEKQAHIFPSDGICEECRSKQPKTKFKGNTRRDE